MFQSSNCQVTSEFDVNRMAVKLKVTHSIGVSEYIGVESPQQEHIERMKYQIWHELYGELQQQYMRVEREVMMNSLSTRFPELEKLSKMLRFDGT